MTLWRKNFLITGTISFAATAILLILFIVNSSALPFDSNVFCFIPILLELLSTACFVGYTVSLSQPWRKKLLFSGIILFASTIIFLKFFVTNGLDFPLSNALSCFIPITLELLSTACFTVYTITRPNTENWFPRTLAVVFVGGMLAFTWYAAWYVN